MLRQISPNLVLNHAFSKFDVFETFFDFFLEGAFEVEFVDAIKWHNRMQQMISVQTFGAYFFLAFKAK